MSGSVARFNVEDAEWMGRQVAFLEEFRKLNQNITANQILGFMHVALNPGISQRELCEKTGLDDGTIARIMALLSERGLRDRPGVGVIEIGRPPGEYRRSAQFLTPKGRRVLDTLRRLLKAK